MYFFNRNSSWLVLFYLFFWGWGWIRYEAFDVPPVRLWSVPVGEAALWGQEPSSCAGGRGEVHTLNAVGLSKHSGWLEPQQAKIHMNFIQTWLAVLKDSLVWRVELSKHNTKPDSISGCVPNTAWKLFCSCIFTVSVSLTQYHVASLSLCTDIDVFTAHISILFFTQACLYVVRLVWESEIILWRVCLL